jgi:hypothetical protein
MKDSSESLQSSTVPTLYENSSFSRNIEGRHERQCKVVDLVFRAIELPNLSSLQVIECTLNGALLCRRLGLQRKYFFLIFKAAALYVEMNDYIAASKLLKALAERMDCSDGCTHAWRLLIREVLSRLSEYTFEVGDFRGAGKAVSSLLLLIAQALNEHDFHTRYIESRTCTDANVLVNASSTDGSTGASNELSVSDRYTEFSGDYSFKAVVASPISALRKLTSQKSSDEFERYLHCVHYFIT